MMQLMQLKQKYHYANYQKEQELWQLHQEQQGLFTCYVDQQTKRSKKSKTEMPDIPTPHLKITKQKRQPKSQHRMHQKLTLPNKDSMKRNQQTKSLCKITYNVKFNYEKKKTKQSLKKIKDKEILDYSEICNSKDRIIVRRKNVNDMFSYDYEKSRKKRFIYNSKSRTPIYFYPHKKQDQKKQKTFTEQISNPQTDNFNKLLNLIPDVNLKQSTPPVYNKLHKKNRHPFIQIFDFHRKKRKQGKYNSPQVKQKIQSAINRYITNVKIAEHPLNIYQNSNSNR